MDNKEIQKIEDIAEKINELHNKIQSGNRTIVKWAIEMGDMLTHIKSELPHGEYIPWVEVNRTEDSNYFLVDTSWFIPNDYYMEFKIESGNELRTYHDTIQFEIVSEKDWC